MISDALEGRGAYLSLEAGRRFACSIYSPELASSLASRLPVSCSDDRWGALAPHPDVVLRILAGANGFFFRREKAVLSSLRMADKSCIALIKVNSFCPSMMLRQELLYTTQDTGLPMPPLQFLPLLHLRFPSSPYLLSARHSQHFYTPTSCVPGLPPSPYPQMSPRWKFLPPCIVNHHSSFVFRR